MRALRRSMAIGVAMGVFAACASDPHAHERAVPGEAIVPSAPLALSLERMDGTRVDVAQGRGRAVLVIAVLMDNVNAQALLRNVELVARAHVDDLVIYAIAGDRRPYAEMRTLLPVWAHVLDLRHTQLLIADDAVRDGASPLGLIDAVPTTFLVNRAGVVARKVLGYLEPDQIEALIAPALPPRRAGP